MRILFVFRNLSERGGGAERVAIELANELTRRGHQIEILSSEAQPGKPFFQLSDAVRVSNVEVRKPKKLIRKVLAHVSPLSWWLKHGHFVRGIRQTIRRNQPDVVVAFMPSGTTVSAVATLGLSVPLIASFHNEPHQDFENPGRWDANPFDVYLRRRFLRRFSRITVLLPAFANWFPEYLWERIVVLPNPIATFSQEKGEERTRIVLGVGWLTPHKRYDLLIKAWALVANDFPDWRVEIFGDGPERERLQELIAERKLSRCVFLQGQTKDIAEQYRRASLLCHPAEYEGFGLAVAEALAAGVPAIAFADCPGVNSLILNGENGILVSSAMGAENAMANAIRELIQNESMRAEMSRCAPETMKRFAPGSIYDVWVQMIQELLANKMK